MKYIFILILLPLLACNNNNTIPLDTITTYTIIDPHEESFDFNGQLIQPFIDTVFYQFQENGLLVKTLHDYSVIDDKIILEQSYTVEREYLIDKNRIFIYPPSDLALTHSFGKDHHQWEVLKLNSDTMIVDLYQNKLRVGHCGFVVSPNE